jgi:hypothetical protein
MKRRASDRMRGSKLSQAHRDAISMGQLGNKRGPEVGKKIRAAHFARIGSLEERFLNIIEESHSGCWLWRGNRDDGGYGVTPGKNPPERRAHRMAFYLFYGPIPPGMCVCHSCDTPPCCNPEHLFIGTNADNIKDASRKGRMSRFGEKNAMYGRRKGPDGKFHKAI